ncbi:hypothetical protein [Hymenobacter cavernae]|uniref:Acid-shock protein n=1 Tax=Hymenobacter cavernae TaxID=2044852 RepID=A0ABQ1UJF2_9BACT|nr:hypothetical protein [Hymenobacter cavernae]GGF18316.1 hypothetical protein GCM10011383_32250 [Hymenobacter cavernae]
MKRLFSAALVALALTVATAPAVLAQGDTTKVKSNKKTAKVKTEGGKAKIDKKDKKAKIKGDQVQSVTP